MNSLAHLAKRHHAARRFKRWAVASVAMTALLLMVLLGSILMPGMQGLQKTEIAIAVQDERALTQRVIQKALLETFPDAKDRRAKMALLSLVSPGSANAAKQERGVLWLPASDIVTRWYKGEIDVRLPEHVRGVTDQQMRWLTDLEKRGHIRRVVDWGFFLSGDSRQPVKAGFGGGIVGSLLLVLVCMAAAFPVGVLAAVYLEEFSRKSMIRDVIEVTINNLAAVPSIVFGLLGLSVFLIFFGMPRSSPLAGGLTLALMVLPVIIIATRVSLQSVPPSIREAALALGASPLQVVFHHTLPLAMPGIMTGTILSVARALGETAPLIMIGMVAFIADVPKGIFDPATVMPVQIYIWASSPERGFIDKTAAGILVLMTILLLLNALAIYLRKRYEVRW